MFTSFAVACEEAKFLARVTKRPCAVLAYTFDSKLADGTVFSTHAGFGSGQPGVLAEKDRREIDSGVYVGRVIERMIPIRRAASDKK